MRRRRRFGILFGVLAFAVLCAAALFSPLRPSTFFSGLPGIEDEVADQVDAVLADNGIAGASVSVDGRDVSVVLPGSFAGQADAIATQIGQQDGVGAVSLASDGVIDPEPVPTAETVPTAEPVPTAETVPTAEPVPTAETVPTAEPAPDPTPTETPAPTIAELVAAIDASDVEFEPGTAILTPTGTAALDNIAPQLQTLSGVSLEVQAHMANDDDPDVNLLLSQDRALAVTDYLVDLGVDAPLLTSRGYGASQPIADNSTEQGRAANQRVAFVVEGN